MNKNTQKVIESVLKQLSAVRITMSDEEQAVLDSMVLRSQVGKAISEVEAHRGKNLSAGRTKNLSADRSKNLGKGNVFDAEKGNALKVSMASDADEVEAHRGQNLRTQNLGPGKGNAFDAEKGNAMKVNMASEADEVEAHNMVSFSVAFDPESGTYRLIPR